MSYENPQGWNDVDAGGNPLDWSSRKNKLLYPAYEMLRLALKERCDACGYTLPAILSNKIDSNTFISYEWKQAFQNVITAIIPYFVNHTINNGDYSGLNDIPMWTESDILEAIEATERIPISYLFLADWEIQQYKILNKLIWVTEDGNLTQNNTQLRKGSSGIAGQFPNYTVAYTDALNDYNSNTWNDISWTPYGYIYAAKISSPDDYICQIYNVKTQYQLDYTNGKAHRNMIYLYIDKYQNSGYFANFSIYPLTQAGYINIGEVINGNMFTYNFENNTPSYPATDSEIPTGYFQDYWGWKVVNHIYIYDYTEDFKFIDSVTST